MQGQSATSGPPQNMQKRRCAGGVEGRWSTENPNKHAELKKVIATLVLVFFFQSSN